MKSLLILRWRQARNGLHGLSGSGRGRVLTGLLVLLATGAGIFWGFYRAFFFLQAFPGMGQVLIERLLFLFTFSLFALLVFSNAAISFQLHFRSRETGYLHSLPLPPRVIYRFLLAESSVLSTAASFFFTFPVVLAYGLTHPLPGPTFLLLPGFAAGLAALATLAGTLAASLITYPLTRGISRKIIAAGLIIIALAIPLQRLLTPPPRPETGRPALMIDGLLEHSRITLSPVLPGFWAAEGFLAAGRGEFRRGLGFLAVLAVNVLLAAEIVRLTGERSYPGTWAAYQSRRPRRRRKAGSGMIPRTPRRPAILGPSPARAILVRDWKLFVRDPAQWLQASILGGLLALYILNIRNMPGDVRQPFWKNLITFFNLGATSLILATLTTRFLYPAFSLEGRAFWILGPAPIRRETLFRVRFWGGWAAAAAFAGPLILLSSRILEISAGMTVLTAAAALLISGVLVSLATGLGAVFPDYDEESPARIASGFGGNLNLVLSLIYVGVTVGGLALIGHLRNFPGLPGAAAASGKSAALIALVSLAGLFLPYRLGVRALRRREF